MNGNHLCNGIFPFYCVLLWLTELLDTRDVYERRPFFVQKVSIYFLEIFYNIFHKVFFSTCHILHMQLSERSFLISRFLHNFFPKFLFVNFFSVNSDIRLLEMHILKWVAIFLLISKILLLIFYTRLFILSRLVFTLVNQ